MATTAPILAADTGGTIIKLGVVQNGAVLAQKSIPAQSDRPLAERLPVIAAEWQALCKQVNLTTRDCGGIGIFFIQEMISRVQQRYLRA